MRYKLIATDYDDTLARDDVTVSVATRHAISDYIAAGGVFTLATGRATRSAVDICRVIGLKGYVITFQGAQIVDIETEKPLFSAGFEPSVAVEICSYLDSRGLYYHVFEGDEFVADKDTYYGRMYEKEAGCKRRIVSGKLTDYILNNGVRTSKILLIDDAKNGLNNIKDVTDNFGDKCFASISKPHLTEIVPLGINKAFAVKKLGEMLNVTQAETVCIGDSLNDMPMIKWAGLGVCVANGREELKKAADVIAPSNNDDGVKYIIEKYGLGE